jgi:uncharacterized repeat protein (TIGR01451 family)
MKARFCLILTSVLVIAGCLMAVPASAAVAAQGPVWSARAAMPVPVSSFCYAVSGGQIYVLGGDVNGASSTTVQRYTAVSDTWETDTNHGGALAPLPQPRSFYSVCGAINGKIHLVGGWQNGSYRSDHFIYSPASNQWTTGPALPSYPIGQFGTVLGDRLYVLGGWWGSYSNSVLEYSEAGGWRSRTPMPTARNHGMAAAFDGKLYAMGGQVANQAVDVVEAYDPATNTWTSSLAKLPMPRQYLGSSGAPIAGGIIYQIGGGANAYGYDPRANTWQIYGPLPAGCWGVAAIDGTLYALTSDHTFSAGVESWPMFHRDAAQSGRSPLNGPGANDLAWTFTTGGAINDSSPAVAADGTIYIGSGDHKLYAVKPDGTLRWAYTTGAAISSSPAIGPDGTVYVGSLDHSVYAVRPDGTLRWSHATGGEVYASPTVGSDGTVYVGSMEGSLYALYPDGGLKCSRSAGPISAPVSIGPDGTLYVPLGTGYLTALHPDCSVAWQSATPVHGIWTAPALSPDGATLYHGADDGFMYARRTSDGSVKWKSPFTYGGVQSTPAVGRDGTVYVGTQYGNLWALDPATGEKRWEYYTTLQNRSSPAIGADGTIYFATAYGQIYAMNPDGTVRWNYQGSYGADGHFFSSPAIGSGGVLYVGSTNGGLYAFHAPPCEPVSSVSLLRDPAGDIHAGESARFTVTAHGSTPYTYTWTLNAAPAGTNLSYLDTQFAADGNNTVGVTVANACGQDSQSLAFSVQPQVVSRPDLSLSSLTSNLAAVENGDVLSYTLTLRNGSATAASATVTDVLPAYTAYVTNSAWASAGTVNVSGGQLSWTGQVVAGTPVVVTFAAQVEPAPNGAAIDNTARIADGAGTVVERTAHAVYNPGFALSINNGALYTNVPTVTLSISWGVTDPPIQKLFISNDCGFGSGTGWIPITNTKTGWALAIYGTQQIPRTVYLKFRMANGLQYGPIQDDIIYDPVAPQVTVVSVSPAAQGAAGLNRAVQLQIRAADDNSGVGQIQVSNRADFAGHQEYAAPGGAVNIRWATNGDQPIYVRAVDRAGNMSPTAVAAPRWRISLPLVMVRP